MFFSLVIKTSVVVVLLNLSVSLKTTLFFPFLGAILQLKVESRIVKCSTDTSESPTQCSTVRKDLGSTFNGKKNETPFVTDRNTDVCSSDLLKVESRIVKCSTDTSESPTQCSTVRKDLGSTFNGNKIESPFVTEMVLLVSTFKSATKSVFGNIVPGTTKLSEGFKRGKSIFLTTFSPPSAS